MNDKQRKAMFAKKKKFESMIQKEIIAEKKWESQQSPQWHKEKKLEEQLFMDRHEKENNILMQNFNDYIKNNKNLRIKIEPISDIDKKIVLKYIDNDLLDKYNPPVYPDDLKTAREKILNNNYNFTIKEANALHRVSDVNEMLLDENPDLNESQKYQIAKSLDTINFWDQRDKWASGFVKYNNIDEVRKAEKTESKLFNENFLGFDKFKRMTFKGGNEPVYDQYGKHLKTGKSIHEYRNN